MAGQIKHSNQLASQVRAGLEQNDFAIYYQPKFDHDSEDIVSVEALLRWHHPTEGFCEAGRFMPAIESSHDLTEQVDAWVLQTTTHQARQWLDDGLVFGNINVNISSWHAGSKLVDMVKTALRESKLPAKSLALECPWRMLTVDIDGISETMRLLRKLGCAIVLDGNPLDPEYLTQVSRTPVQMSKVCMAHIQELLDSEGVKKLSAIIKKWQKAGVQIVAMGVEHEDEATLSHKIGCRFIQGNRFKCALTEEEVNAVLMVMMKTKKALTLM